MYLLTTWAERRFYTRSKGADDHGMAQLPSPCVHAKTRRTLVKNWNVWLNQMLFYTYMYFRHFADGIRTHLSHSVFILSESGRNWSRRQRSLSLSMKRLSSYFLLPLSLQHPSIGDSQMSSSNSLLPKEEKRKHIVGPGWAWNYYRTNRFHVRNKRKIQFVNKYKVSIIVSLVFSRTKIQWTSEKKKEEKKKEKILQSKRRSERLPTREDAKRSIV